MENKDLLGTFSSYEFGWDGYKAEPPNAWSIDEADRMLEFFISKGKIPDRVRASVIGGVGVAFYKNNKKVYVEIDNSGKIHALFSDYVTEPEVMKVVDYNNLLDRIDVYFKEWDEI